MTFLKKLSHTLYRWYHTTSANAPNRPIFQKNSLKFSNVSQYVIITSLLKLPEITKCYLTWKASCFRWYHSFSKISFILILRFIRPFMIGVYALLSSITLNENWIKLIHQRLNFSLKGKKSNKIKNKKWRKRKNQNKNCRNL